MPLGGAVSRAEVVQAAEQSWSLEGVFGEGCVHAYPAARWKCLLGQYRLEQLRSPYRGRAHQYDRYLSASNAFNGSWNAAARWRMPVEPRGESRGLA